MNDSLPVLSPVPQELRGGDGVCELAAGVRLEAAELTVLQRKFVGQLLAAGGVRLHASAGTHLRLTLGAQPPAHVPRSATAEYYRLQVGPAEIAASAVAWEGLLWSLRTLVDLVRWSDHGSIPALEIHDWPDLPHRGILVENKWGPDRMEREDWFRVVDRLAANKMNRLGIGLYGCWGSCRYEPGPSGNGWPTEFLMVPVDGYPQLRSSKRLHWFSPSQGAWRDETYLPRLFAGDFLGEVVEYARARGVTVVPFVNSLGHNTLIPRLLPQVSARDAHDTPLGIGYCLSRPEVRAFIESFYAGIIDRYFAGHAPLFHVQLDEVWADNADPADPLRRVEPWCQCGQCRARGREQLLQDYVIWLVEMLTRRGVDQVVIWNDQLTRHMQALDGSFVEKLRTRGLAERLILHWWWYSNEELNERTRVSIGRELGLRGWVAPMTCYYNWQMYAPRLPNIELMMRMAHTEGAEGAVAYAVHDPGWADHEALLAGYAWNGTGAQEWPARVELWARGRFGILSTAYLEAVALLRQAAETPALARCYAYTYTYSRAGKPFPRAYPGEALEELETLSRADAQLQQAATLGQRAAAAFAALGKQVGAEDGVLLRSLQAEGARIQGLAGAFAYLVRLHGQLLKDPESARVGCREAGATLRAAMAQVEQGKPDYVVPAALQGLSMLLAFLEQLQTQLDQRGGDGGDLTGLSWALQRPYCEETHDEC